MFKKNRGQLGALVALALVSLVLTSCGATPMPTPQSIRRLLSAVSTPTPRPPTPTPRPTMTPTAAPRMGTICCADGDQVYVRRSANMDDKTATLLAEGTQLAVVATKDGWAQISAPAVGYIPPQYWTYDPAVATPTSEPAPPPADIGGLGKVAADMVLVPAGEFRMGSEDDTGRRVTLGPFWFEITTNSPAGDADEKPAHTVYLDEFQIDKTEVTNAAFARFVDVTGYRTTAEQPNDRGGIVFDGSGAAQVAGTDWRHPSGPSSSIVSRQDYPVVQVSWDDAMAYCSWAAKRLPTEAEWEKAARGTDGRIYPWGDTWDSTKANIWESGPKAAVRVASYAAGVSPYGALDMAGNVWEWVADWYDPVYYAWPAGRNPSGPLSGDDRVVRGGGWYSVHGDSYYARSTFRDRSDPQMAADNLGFRCAKGSPR